MTKTCYTCKVKKSVDLFSKDSSRRDGLRARCKSCDSIKAKQWREKDIEKARRIVRESDARYRARHPEKLKAKHLRIKYDLSLESYKELLAKFNGLCYICNTREATCVDHCHLSGAVRGLLCTQCNYGLGNFNDNPEWLLKAIEYLAETIQAVEEHV